MGGTSRSEEKIADPRVRALTSVNTLPLIGGTIGLISLFLPWRTWSEGLWHDSLSFIDIMAYSVGNPLELPLLAILLFAAGTLLAFVTPAAGFVQATGLALFSWDSLDGAGSMPHYLDLDSVTTIGFLAGVVSAALVVAGFVMPIGPGCDLSRGRWARRADTVACVRTGAGQAPSQKPGTPRDLFREVAKQKRWGVAWIITALLFVPMILSYSPSFDDYERVTGDVDGVSILLGSGLNAAWNHTDIVMNDTMATVSWSADWTIWEAQTLTPVALGEMNLSGLILNLTILDWSGEGRATQGDLLILTPLNESSFSEGIIYSLMVATRSIGWGMPRSSVSVDFVFEDGEIESVVQATTYDLRALTSVTIIEKIDPRYHTADLVEGTGMILATTLVLGTAYYLLIRPLLLGRKPFRS